MGQALFDNIFSGASGVAKTLLNILGGDAEIIITSEVYDPLTGTSTQTSNKYPADASPPENYTIKEIDGTNILSGDMKTMVPASDTPKPIPNKSTITIAGSVFNIVSVESLYSGNLAATYILQLRK